jgi:serine protease Do
MKRLLAFSVCFICLITVKSFCAQRPFAQGDRPLLEQLSDSYRDLAARVSPAVVQVQTRGLGPVQGDSSNLLTSQEGSGSGIILDSNGYIVTNYHVVEGAQRVEVLLVEREQRGPDEVASLELSEVALPAEIVGVDPDTDLAVLKIDRKGLPFLKLADSSQLRQGQLVLACGSPLGLENTVTMGVISSVGRQLRNGNAVAYIQTDAPINPGNSGGPLVNMQGDVVGINTLILSQSGGNEGLGFAIPSNVVKNVFHQIREVGHVHRGFIGMRGFTITRALAKGLALPRTWGVIVDDVMPGGPADVAGVQVGDIVLTLDGKVMIDARIMAVGIFQHAIDEKTTLVVLRGKEKLTIPVTVTERPDDPLRFAEKVTKESNLIPQLGILALDIDEKMANEIGPLRKPAKVMVAAKVLQARPSSEGFEVADLICSLNGQPVASAEALRTMLAKMHSGDPAVIQVQRSNSLTFLVFELP